MRIISGDFRGKKLLAPNNNLTRPLKDLTKESIFNIIKHSKKFNIDVEKSNILDLFAGVGSFGLECISRKARHVTFVENYKEALFILKKNILNLKKSNSYLIIEKNIFKELKFNFFKSKFDIIFMDPPYKEKKISELISNIMEAKILSKDGILIIHRHKNENNEFPKAFNIIEKKTYGISSIFFGNFV